jgi:hypothetical protein
MQKHITREIEDAQLASVTDAIDAAVRYVREASEQQVKYRTNAPLKLPFEAEKKAAAVDDAISSVAENSAAEYVRKIARGEGPAERQQFSLGSQLSWNPGRVLPQFLFQGKPILLTDPEQVARWDRLAQQESEEDAPGRMAQLFKVQSKPAPRNISLELEKSAAGKIVFESADRPGWDKVIYYHAGEKRAAERLAEILRNNRELSEQQQAEAWRLEGWPEADVARELERVRNVQRMHDESWWTPQPSLMERARQQAKNLLSFGRGKETARAPFKETARIAAKAETEQAQRLLGEIQGSPERIARSPRSAPLNGEIQRSPERIARLPRSAPLNGEIQRSPERIARLPRSVPLKIEGPTEAELFGGMADAPRPESVPDAPTITGFDQTDIRAAMRLDLDGARTNGAAKFSTGLTRQDEPVYRWLEAAMEEVHKSRQRQRGSLKGKR